MKFKDITKENNVYSPFAFAVKYIDNKIFLIDLHIVIKNKLTVYLEYE